jgi:hypothetical protein
MKRRLFAIMILVFALTALSTPPPAKADPLTIIAIVGVGAVVSVSAVDLMARSDDDDNKDMRAQQEEPRQLIAKKERPSTTAGAAEATVAKP